MNPINELDRAEIRHQARELYRDIGFEGSLEALMESMVFCEELARVINEERFGQTEKE